MFIVPVVCVLFEIIRFFFSPIIVTKTTKAGTGLSTVKSNLDTNTYPMICAFSCRFRNQSSFCIQQNQLRIACTPVWKKKCFQNGTRFGGGPILADTRKGFCSFLFDGFWGLTTTPLVCDSPPTRKSKDQRSDKPPLMWHDPHPTKTCIPPGQGSEWLRPWSLRPIMQSLVVSRSVHLL